MVRGQKTKGLDQSKERGGGEIKTKEKSLETGEGSES